MELNTQDVAAAGDVFDAVAEASDSLTIEDAIAYSQALAAAQVKLRDAIGLIDTQLRKLLDSPRQVGSKVYMVKADGKWRPEHDVIKKAIISRSITDNNGALLSPAQAAERAVTFTYAAFVSASMMPKLSALEKFGLEKKDVARWEKTGTKVVVQALEEEE